MVQKNRCRSAFFIQRFNYLVNILLCISACHLEVAHAVDTAPVSPVRDYVEATERARYSELLENFGQHKVLPEGYELQALIALSHFPELKNVKIQFIVKNVGIAISSRPKISSLLKSARKRTYLIVIDTELQGPRSALLLKNQPFNAQIGILGHELAHTVYYLKRSFFGIVSDGVCQIGACRQRFERDTDKRLIRYGLGWQRYDHSRFVRDQFSLHPETSKKTSIYMGPDELLDIIQSHHFYQSKTN
ncbi:MAG: hypothetical protein ACRBEE_02280 [Arenicella sp.]